jgi:hypothetical protein
MNSRPSPYRSTLIAAALAVGCFGAASAASAHEHGGRERDGDRHGDHGPRGWHERGEQRGWGYYRPAPGWRPYVREPSRYDGRGYLMPDGYDGYQGEPPVVVYRPAPRAAIVYGNPDLSVMIHVPL